ncbi:MAG: RNase P subunit p30 family protein [Acidilobaceae archaeon]
MKSFADLSLKPKDTETAVEMLRLARSLGYKLVCLEASDSIDYGIVSKLSEDLGLRLCLRVTVEGRTRKEVRVKIDQVKKSLKKDFFLLAVSAKDLDALRYSATCKEVVLTRVEPGAERFIDRSQVRLFAQRGWGAVELVLRPVLVENKLDYLYVAITRALRSGLEVIVSSDSRDVWEMWSPYHIVGLLVALGVPEAIARTWISSAGARVVERAFINVSRFYKF